MSESSGTVTVKRSSKGLASFAEVSQNGNFVRIENGSTKEIDMSNWQIERGHPKGKSTFKFPGTFKLGPRKSVKIWANAWEDEAEADDLVAPRSTCKNWGVGSGNYTLTDAAGDDKAFAKVEFK